MAVATDRIADSVGYSSAALAYGWGTDSVDDWDVNVFAHYRQFASTEGVYVPADLNGVGTRAIYANADEYHQRDSMELLVNGNKGGFYFDLLLAENQYGMPIYSYDSAFGFETFRDAAARLDYKANIVRLGYRDDRWGNAVIDTSVQYGQFDSDHSTGEYTNTYRDWYFDIPTERLNLDLRVNHEPILWDRLTIDAGVGYYLDEADISDRMASTLASVYGVSQATGKEVYETGYLFLQGFVDLDAFNLTVGLRSEDHEAFGRVTVPRFALTYLQDPFHFKALAARSYKAPPL